ncbi:cupin domain-containing protein [Elongatibacter sediminis]|uniref:Cupin domain-containing protein n=1 Tax=Elongatibacter sediminis TaxID=3119006 RepID=A0AAW9RC19_9GAMM
MNRKSTRLARTTLFCGIAACTVSLTTVAGEIEQIDPVALSPDMYSLLLENEHVRIVEYQIAPGEKEPWHTHPAKAMYVVDGGTLQITLPDGTSFVTEEEAGEAHWMGAVGRHYGTNVGDTTVRLVMVEVKGADAVAEDAESLKEFAEPGS